MSTDDSRFVQYLDLAALAKAGKPEQLLDELEAVNVLLKVVGDDAESVGELRLAVACNMVAQLSLMVAAFVSVNGTAQNGMCDEAREQ